MVGGEHEQARKSQGGCRSRLGGRGASHALRVARLSPAESECLSSVEYTSIPSEARMRWSVGVPPCCAVSDLPAHFSFPRKRSPGRILHPVYKAASRKFTSTRYSMVKIHPSATRQNGGHACVVPSFFPCAGGCAHPSLRTRPATGEKEERTRTGGEK